MDEEKVSLFKRKSTKIILAVIAGIVIISLIFLRQEEPEYVVAEVTRGDIVQSVSVTGTIKADPTIDLHFQKTGKVKEIYVEEGDFVEKDHLLASLENEALELEIERQRANLNYAIAQYNQTKAGAKYEEILIAEAEVESADAALDAAIVERDKTEQLGGENIKLASLAFKQAEQNKDAAYKEFLNTKDLAEKEIAKLDLAGDNVQTIALESAYTTALTQLDTFFTVLQDSLVLAEETIGVRGSGYILLPQSVKTSLKNNYHEPAQADYNDALDLYQSLPSDPTNEEVDIVINSTLTAGDSLLLLLSQIGFELEKLNLTRTDLQELILEISNQSSTLSNSIINLQDTKTTIASLKLGSEQDIETLKLSYQLQIDAAENNYLTAQNASSEAAFNLDQAKINADIANKNADAFVALKQAALDSAIATLSLKKSPARDVDLAPLLAQITQAEIALQISEKEFRDSQLFAPIEGIITFIYGEVGENISLTETSISPFLSMQADNLIVEANVPETDVVKVEVGDRVEMTVDAFDFTEKLYGEVIYIDPAETAIQGVIYYEIKTAFDIEDERIKSGMTVNLEIETDKKTDVLIIPLRGIRFEDSIRYVELLKNGFPEKTTITTGIENDQYAEVLSGLKEGDKIVTFVR